MWLRNTTRALPRIFQKDFEAAGGKVVAFESYTTDDKDFSSQLTIIKAATPGVLFLPNYYNEVPLQVQQARRLGITCPIIGSDSWGSAEILFWAEPTWTALTSAPIMPRISLRPPPRNSSRTMKANTAKSPTTWPPSPMTPGASCAPPSPRRGSWIGRKCGTPWPGCNNSRRDRPDEVPGHRRPRQERGHHPD